MPPQDALRACALFKGFTETGLQILAGIALERSYPRGAPLFVENMVAESLFIIAEGRVGITVHNGLADLPLGELQRGDSLGELALVQQGQRLCTAVALTGVAAIELRSVDFQRLMTQKPQACLKLLMAIVSQFGARLQANREAFRALLPRP
jgi:CRP/FNR family cyclic AMP-dependent transcriptional regulator